eukprot:TRINITY_DN2685_c0_g4_i1.p1 TRINITY_DN2685_c0_g4~~TRINITY_DN2685_c0_g4_i1.p1  ORF type:complete len:128 (-),score=10.03 TRINITY_DN2685_c0_g4_i1:3-386(-)
MTRSFSYGVSAVMPVNCPLCNKPFEQDNAHFLSCIMECRRRVNAIHDTVVRILQEHLKLYLNATVYCEPKPFDGQDRPYLHVIQPDGSQFMIDVAFIHACAISHSRVKPIALHAVAEAETTKHNITN